ncbi:MAG TPA: hypothetical protein VJ881_09480 [Halanaerobiales bacterium]|nr:hypothetical protein [Halanaerobiales bacterium]
MRNNILISLFTGIIAYSLTTLINLINANPLKEVLYNGIIALFVVALITFLITYILDNYQPDKNSKKGTAGDNNKKKNNKSNREEKEAEEESKEDEFSPMDPTVLEVEEEESN